MFRVAWVNVGGSAQRDSVEWNGGTQAGRRSAGIGSRGC